PTVPWLTGPSALSDSVVSFFLLSVRPQPSCTLFPYTTLFRSRRSPGLHPDGSCRPYPSRALPFPRPFQPCPPRLSAAASRCGFQDRKSTRLNSSHVKISYAVFCLKKKKQHIIREVPQVAPLRG